jgi:hypothetical protein
MTNLQPVVGATAAAVRFVFSRLLAFRWFDPPAPPVAIPL